MKQAWITTQLVNEGHNYSLTAESGEVLAERIATSLNLRRHQPVKDELATIAAEQGYELIIKPVVPVVLSANHNPCPYNRCGRECAGGCAEA